MDRNALAIVVFLLLLAILAVVVRVAVRKTNTQPGYAGLEESRALRGVIAMAFQAKGISVISLRPVNRYDPPYQDLWFLQNRLKGAGLPGTVLTRDEVALIVPFVERWLSGELPHLLAPEYDDEMRVPLLRYKARMQANGLWPKTT